MRAYLDNIQVQNMTESLLYPSITVRKKDENGDPAFGFSGEVTFIESEYYYIYNLLKTSANYRTNEITLRFEDDCCGSEGKKYEFKITHKSLQWCEGKCEVKVTPIEKSTTNDQLTCLKNKLIWDDYNGFKSIKHPRMAYCNEVRPNWMQHVMMILGIVFGNLMLVLSPILLVLGVIVVIINAIIGAINSLIPGDENDLNKIDFDNDPSTNVFQEMTGWYNQLMSWIVGCGRKHPSPLVTAYARNVCGACGLQFQSSIFDGNKPYASTVYVNAPVHKGTVATDNTTHWIDENKPLLSGKMFFDQLKIIFNAEYRVKNNILRFERKDNFQYGNVWLDLTTYDPDNTNVCWSWQDKTAFSYGNFKYFKDAVNWVGSEAADRWNDIVEWNNPYNTGQSGEFAPLIPFAACRFRDDGIEEDILTKYEDAPFIGPVIKGNKRSMLMNTHNCYQPMLIIWDQTSGLSNAKASGSDYYFPGYYTPGGQPVGLNQFYNYPFWFDAQSGGNLYDNFFAIEDPRTNGFKGLQFVADLPFDCSILSTFDIDESVLTSEGQSREITEININYKSGRITIKGVV